MLFDANNLPIPDAPSPAQPYQPSDRIIKQAWAKAAWDSVPPEQQTPELELALPITELIMQIKTLPVPPQIKNVMLNTLNPILVAIDPRADHIAFWNKVIAAAQREAALDQAARIILPPGVRRRQ